MRFGTAAVPLAAVSLTALAAALVGVGVVAGPDLLGVSPAVPVVGVVVVALGAVVVVCRGLDGLAVGLLGLAVASSPWNAVALGQLKLAHLALAAALAALVVEALARRRPVRVPGWVWLLGATIGVICVLSVLWPPTLGYFASRYVEDVPDAEAALTSLGAASMVAGLKWLVAAVGLPIAVCLAVVRRPALIATLACAWVLGTTISAAVALTDQIGLTHLGGTTLPSISFDLRQAGLSIHPNHLALSIALALPVGIWWLVRSTAWTRTALVVALAVMTGGLLLTGSRAGIAGAVVAAGLALVVDARTRRLVPALVAGVAVAGALVAAALPDLVQTTGHDLRFVKNDSAQQSDSIRAGLGRQALTDFEHSPVHGIGFEVLAQGHDIYLQLLANGGLILLLGFLLAQLGCLLEGWSVDDGGSGLARALTVGAATYLIVGVVENQLADVFVQIPLALVAGCWAAARTTTATPSAAPSSPDAAPPVPAPPREEIFA